MHLTWWQVYLWLKLDDLPFVFGVFYLLLCIYIAVYFLKAVLKEDLGVFIEGLKSFTFKILFTLAIVFMIASFLLPTSKQFALIYILPKIVNSKTVHEIFSKTGKDIGLLLEYAGKELEHKLKEIVEDGVKTKQKDKEENEREVRQEKKHVNEGKLQYLSKKEEGVLC